MTRRGLTLVECLVALVVSSVLLSAVEMALLAGHRFSRVAAGSRLVRQNLRAAESVLRGELQQLAPGNGDLAQFSDSAVVLRGLRGFGVACTVTPGTLVLDDSTLSLARPVNAASDSVRVFDEGDALTEDDDRWVDLGVSQVRSASCPGGSSGTALAVTGASSDLADIEPGAPVRVFEIAEYRRYKDAAGVWWLGVRNPLGPGWSATSPIAGPLVPRVGFALSFVDSGLVPSAIGDSVAMVLVQLRMQDGDSLNGAGARGGPPIRDSSLVKVALGGP